MFHKLYRFGNTQNKLFREVSFPEATGNMDSSAFYSGRKGENPKYKKRGML